MSLPFSPFASRVAPPISIPMRGSVPGACDDQWSTSAYPFRHPRHRVSHWGFARWACWPQSPRKVALLDIPWTALQWLHAVDCEVFPKSSEIFAYHGIMGISGSKGPTLHEYLWQLHMPQKQLCSAASEARRRQRLTTLRVQPPGELLPWTTFYIVFRLTLRA